MTISKKLLRWIFWPIALTLIAGTTYYIWQSANKRREVPAAHSKNQQPEPEENPDDPPTPETQHVTVVHPQPGKLDRVTVLPCSVRAFESVNLRPQVSGYLKQYKLVTVEGNKKRPLDIGDAVQAGEVLAVIDVPEIEKQLERNAFTVELCKTRVDQMKAKVGVARADYDAAQAKIAFAEANVKAATAMLTFRSTTRQIYDDLLKLDSIERIKVDEAMQHQEAAREIENASRAAVVDAKAHALAAAEKIKYAEQDVKEAEAQVKVAQADFDKTQVLIAFSQIVAPFNGAVTERNFDPGALIHAEAHRDSQAPILTVQRTDKFRAVVLIPDRYVDYATIGDPAEIEFDGLPGKRYYNLKIDRIAKAEETATRMMRIEIDVENTDGRIRHGMYGKATINLEKLRSLSIPRECLVRSPDGTKQAVFVVRGDDKAYRVPVKLGLDNGLRVEVKEGLRETDEVILRPPGSLMDGAEVQIDRPEAAPKGVEEERP